MFRDMLKDEKSESQFKYELGRLMGEYAVPYLWATSTCMIMKPGGLSFGIIVEECDLTI